MIVMQEAKGKGERERTKEEGKPRELRDGNVSLVPFYASAAGAGPTMKNSLTVGASMSWASS